MTLSFRLLPLAALLALVFGQAAWGKEQRLALRWAELGNSVAVGQKVQVIQTDKTIVGGRVAGIEPEGLVLTIHKKTQTVARTSVARIEFRKKSGRTRGRVIGTAIGGGLGLVVAVSAATIANNEGGRNSGTLVGVGAGIAIATTAAGFFWGRGSDEDFISISLIP